MFPTALFFNTFLPIAVISETDQCSQDTMQMCPEAEQWAHQLTLYRETMDSNYNTVLMSRVTLEKLKKTFACASL